MIEIILIIYGILFIISFLALLSLSLNHRFFEEYSTTTNILYSFIASFLLLGFFVIYGVVFRGLSLKE